METEKIEGSESDPRIEQAEKVIRNHSWGSSGIGLIPLPLVDLVGITGIQLNMMRKLAKIYGIPFSKDKVTSLVGSLVGSVVPVSIAGSAASFVKAIPLVGQTIGVLTMPALAGATTYAVGKVFLMHFSSGGTFLDFDPEKVKAYYSDLLKKKGAIVPEEEKAPVEPEETDEFGAE